MTDQCNYVVPQAQLNVSEHEHGMPYTDAAYPVPIHWLKANASRFVFTPEQIIQAAKPQLMTDYWAGERWCRHPRICGIYFLVDNGRVVYVGQSNHIARRVAQHQMNEARFDSIAFFEAPEFFLKGIEAHYIRLFRPPLNTDVPYNREFSALFLSPSPSTKEMTE